MGDLVCAGIIVALELLQSFLQCSCKVCSFVKPLLQSSHINWLILINVVGDNEITSASSIEVKRKCRYNNNK